MTTKVVDITPRVKRGKIPGNNYKPVQASFPTDLDDVHFMKFHAVKMTNSSAGFNASRKATLATITLPIPANLQQQYAADYEESGIGMAGAFLSGQMDLSDIGEGASALIRDGKEMFTESSNKVAKELGPSLDQLNPPGDGGGGKAVGAIGLTAAAIGGSATLGVLGTAVLGGDIIGGAIKGGFKSMGFIMNPHLASIFTGVGKKSHSFQFKFMAQSEGESAMLQKIINTFRANMLPAYKYGRFGLTYPNEWEISFSAQTQKFLYRISTSVLKSFNVTYNGGGVPVFHTGGAPVEVDMQLTFSETTIETRDDLAIPGG